MNNTPYLTENQLLKIQNPEWSLELEDAWSAYSDASVFLQGSCQLFAQCLCEKFGYEIWKISADDEKSFHIFCATIFQGKKIYIDVRGITKNLADIRAYDKPKVELYKNSLKEDLQEEGADFGYRFAKYIIEQCPDRYDVSKIEQGETI